LRNESFFSAPQLKRDPLGGTTSVVSDSQYWLIKVLIAIPGAVVTWKSYQAFRRRRRDPNAPRDPVTDRWWRIAMYAGGAVLADALTIVATSAIGAPRWLGSTLFAILALSVAVAFLAAFALGWRGALH
jgi:hypothetical protein